MGLLSFRRGSDPSRLEADLESVAVPSFPAAVGRILSLLRDEDSRTDDIGKLVEADPGLHVRVLRTVNSAAFGLSAKIESVARAVTMLGRARLESLVLAVAVKDSLPPSPVPGFDERGFWLASALRATLARDLAKELHPATASEAFTAGLLQDLGVPVLVAAKGEPYCAVWERWRAEPAARLPELEREAFGYCHQEAGALLAERWELPAALVHAVRAHHDGDGHDALDPAVRIVAELRGGNGDGADAAVVPACEAGGLAPERAAEIVAGARASARELFRALS